MFAKLTEKIGSYLGVCPKCMRTAFNIAFAGWLIAIVAEFMLSGPFLYGAFTFAGIATFFWVAHLVAYGIRQVKRIPHCGGELDFQPVVLTRREAIGKFAKLVAGAATFTAIPVWAGGNSMYDCGPNPYADQRTGYGSCQQFCQTTNNEKWDCPKGTRPVYLKNGECTCCSFPECS